MLNFIIKEGEGDQTLISFLKRRFKNTPLSLIYKLFRTKKVKVDSKEIRYYHHRLKVGEEIIVYDNSLIISETNKSIIPKKIESNISIVYEDKNILIVLKEHGITMPELDEIVQYYLYQQNPQEYQELAKKYFAFTAIHRLDRLTKGLIIYPKNPTVKKVLYNSIGDKEKITKKYLAVCENVQKKQLSSYVEGFVWKNEQKKKIEFSLVREKENAKHCSMEIKEIGEENDCLLLEITLHTGRKHQIRSILSYFEIPITGDKKYGSKTTIIDRIYLFAYKIIFDNLPSPLSYLNKKEFSIEKLEKNKSSLLKTIKYY